MPVVVDALVEKVLDVLYSTISDEIRRVAGVEGEVQKLTFSLQSIKAVLIDAERRQWKEEAVKLWLDRLRSVAYDIDDVVDEWSYEILTSSQTQRDETTHEPRRKVSSFHRLFAFFFPKVVSHHHVADKIIDLNARLDVIAAEKDRYNFQLLGTNIVEHNITTPVIDLLEVRGRDVEKEYIVSMLLSRNSEQNALRVISVVGMGGIGKTTLTRLVYDDKRVRAHFHKRIWICVSDPFDETRIAKEILESLQGVNQNLTSLPMILTKIQELVGGDKCLFILDDVWNEDRRKWEQLKNCLKGSASKSSILVTTRNENVGRIMGCLEWDIVRVRELSEDESWELFCMIAFFGRSNEEKASLEKIGREVVKRCKGLPLAIKAISSVLQLKKSVREWRRVLDSELWNHEGFQRDIAPALWLSYYDLPSPLKLCFSHCAIFPKDYVMKKDKLIRHWIAQSYIEEKKSKDMKLVGEEYFQNLVTRSFFQDVEANNIVTLCKIHDIVHDFSRLLVKKECHSIEVNDDSPEISFSNDSFAHSLRHLSISFQSKLKCVDSFYDIKKLRSLIISASRWYFESSFVELDLQKLFNEFTLLRSLKLSECGIEEVPSNINKLIHLRELDLSLNRQLHKLPDTVWELYNLLILDLRHTGMTSSKGVERLAKLRYLGNFGTKCCLPKGLMRLSGLRRLEKVEINVSDGEALSLKHLQNFNQLAGSLFIKWVKRGDGDVTDAKQAQLVYKKHITRFVLDLSFGKEEEEEEERRSKQDEELLEALDVPPNLEFLHILAYMGTRAPKSLHSLTSVKTVQLYFWTKVEQLPQLGKLPCLERLKLIGFYRVEKVGGVFLGMDEMMKSTTVAFFPKLESLKFSAFRDWKEWNGTDEEMLIMPSLTYLEIHGSNKLKALPNFILKKTSLQLDIRFCNTLEQSITKEDHSVRGSYYGVHMKHGD